jgi:hypothetical protein
MSWRVAFGILKHDVKAYIQSYKIACEWAKKYPGTAADDFSALQEQAWAEIEADLQEEMEREGAVVLRSNFAVPEGSKN